MEEQLKEAATKNTKLIEENNLLRKTLVSLENENKVLKASLSQGRLVASRPAALLALGVVLVLGVGYFPNM